MPSSDKQPLKPPAHAAPDADRKPARRRGWRIFFSVFKWCRIAVLLALLVVVVLALFLNRVGLPEWIKQRIVAQMRAKGWDIEFSRMRLRWHRGIVADDLQLCRTNSISGPHLFIETAEFRLNGEALRDFDLHADSVMVQGARLIWPLPGTNQPKQTFALDKGRGELFFNPNDQWELRTLEATLLGARVHLRGDLTNASLIRDWQWPERKPPKPGEEPAEFWRRFLAQADKFRVTGQPEVTAVVSLDARDFRRLEATVRFFALGLDSPWAGGTNLLLNARLLAPRLPADRVRAEIEINAERAHSRWIAGTNLQVALQVEPSLTHWLPTNATAIAELRDAQTPWGRAARALLSVQCQPATNAAFRATQFRLTIEQPQTEWGDAAAAQISVLADHPATNFLPALVQSDVQLSPAHTRWATSDWAQVSARFQLPEATNLFVFATNLSWQARLENIPLEAITTVSNLHAPKLDISFGTLSNHWQSPRLQSKLSAISSDSDATISAGLDVESRDLSFAVATRLDTRQVAPWFGTNAPRWFADFGWRSPLKLETKGRARLPAWTNREPDWKGEVLPTTAMAGRFEMAEGAYRQVEFNSASGLFLFTNLLWSVPELKIGRPEGTLEADYSGDQRTHHFHCNLRSGIDLMALRPLFPQKEARQVFAMFQFTTPPTIHAEVSGNWNDLARLGVAGDVSVTNVVFNEQPVKSCSARVLYTNQFLSIVEPLVLREGERGVASGIGIDLDKQRLYLTNATGNLAPMAIAKAIGNHVVRAIAPYVFELPPQAHVEGEIPFGRSDGSERMAFDLDGGPFHWRNFHLDRLKGLVLWRGEHLALTNLHGRWHGGDVAGWAHFDFSQPRGGLFSFDSRIEGSDLKAVIHDAQPAKTNHIEGSFGGELIVTQAYCNDLKSWFGYGHVYLRDGLLWDIPIFGVFSPVLNTIAPGLGNSRAKQGAATFGITNSIFHSKDVEIRATAMRMQYQGTLDFDTRVDLRMEAELLRDMPGIGIIISKILWPVTKLFEYRVTGTLANPKAEPIWGIPRVILFPFQPIKTLKDIFGEEEKPPGSQPPEKPAAPQDEKSKPPK